MSRFELRCWFDAQKPLLVRLLVLAGTGGCVGGLLACLPSAVVKGGCQ